MICPRLLILFLFGFACNPAFGQQTTTANPELLYARINATGIDTNRVNLWIQLGAYYLQKEGEIKNDLDSAMNNLNRALDLSIKLKFFRGQNEALKLKGATYFEAFDFANGRANFVAAANNYKNTGNRLQEALTWWKFADRIPSRDNNYLEEKLVYYAKGKTIFHALRDTLNEIEISKDIADAHLNEGKLDLSENELLDVLAQFRAIHYPNVHYTYDLLSAVYRLKGDKNKELYYTLEAIKSMERTGDFRSAYSFYSKLATIYFDLKLYDKSLVYFNKTFDLYKKNPGISTFYFIPSEIVRTLIADNKPKEALYFLQKTIQRYPPNSMPQMERIYASFGNCYFALKQNNEAESYYLKMIGACNDIMQSENLPLVKFEKDRTFLQDVIKISEFYIATNQFKKADNYLQKITEFAGEVTTPESISNVQLLQFKIDSAMGNYVAAIAHFQRHKQIEDSLMNATKMQQLQELQIAYETTQKDKNIELQFKNILLLRKQSVLQVSQIKKTQTVRNLMFLGSLLLLMLLAALYNQFLNKKKNNLLLEGKQKEISAKNEKLEHLLHDNEWLLREVHHRVKNNMQTIVGLLNSQSTYLQDETALKAVMDSQHRIQAMSLIHQKLYKSNNVSSVYMPEYISDLIQYLEDSFKIKKHIYIEQSIEPLHLDVIQAIPLGLILNEIVTNSIKYAFPETGNHKIEIRLFKSGTDKITLITSDNGIGMKHHHHSNENKTFGMILINGLIEDLDGHYDIESDHGVKYTMIFNTLIRS